MLYENIDCTLTLKRSRAGGSRLLESDSVVVQIEVFVDVPALTTMLGGVCVPG